MSSSSSRAVSMTIGIDESRRSSRVTSRPSSPGRPRSRTTRSGCRWRTWAQGGVAVGGNEDGEPGVLEVVAGELGDLRLVVDDEDGLHRGHRSSACSALLRRTDAPPDPGSEGARSGGGPPVKPASKWYSKRAAPWMNPARARGDAIHRSSRRSGCPRGSPATAGRGDRVHPSRRTPSRAARRQKMARMQPEHDEDEEQRAEEAEEPEPEAAGCQP